MYWSLIDPEGKVVFDSAFSRDVGNITLGKTGTHTLLLEGYIYRNTSTANYQFNVKPVATTPTEISLGERITGTVAR